MSSWRSNPNPQVLGDVVTVSDAESAPALVRRIQADDQSAKDELVRRYGRAVSALLRKWLEGHPIEEDLYQETFRITLERIMQGKLRDPEKLPGFICRVARNLAIDYHRQRKRRPDHTGLEAIGDHPDSAPSQQESLEQKEKADTVRRVLDELPSDRDREVLFRFYIAGEEKELICADLGLTSRQFNLIKHRALRRFRKLYGKRAGRPRKVDEGE